MTKQLTNADYYKAAKDLKCQPEALMAVAEVESAGGGYDNQGRLVVRFEGHKFREYTFKKYDQSHPHLSYPYKVQKSKQHGYSAFNQAFALDQEAALKASSWGKFQPLAVNHREAGFKNVRDFVDYLRVSEANQLKVFVEMIKFRQLDDELQRLDWAGFARNYNGKSYKDNDYDGKMHRAYLRYKARKINWNDVLLSEREIDNLLINLDDFESAAKIDNDPIESPLDPSSSEIAYQSAMNEESTVTPTLPQQMQPIQTYLPELPSFGQVGEYVTGTLETVHNTKQTFDTLQQISDTVTESRDGKKSLWTVISQTVLQIVWAIVGFIIGIPMEIWIVVALIVAGFAFYYLYRQITLGKMREISKLKN